MYQAVLEVIHEAKYPTRSDADPLESRLAAKISEMPLLPTDGNQDQVSEHDRPRQRLRRGKVHIPVLVT